MGRSERNAWSRLVRTACALALVLVACAPAAPSPTGAPAKPPPAAAPAQPAAPPAPAAAGGASPAAQPGAPPDSQAEWDKVVAAAKQEGKVVVAGPPGQIFREAALEFQKKYPEIGVELTGMFGRDLQPRILGEQQAGQYVWDVYIGGPQSGYALKSRGAFEPIRPALVLPEVLDSGAWFGGFEEGFMDNERQFVYGFQGYVQRSVLVNRASVPESELSSVEQLVDPKWKGKISWQEPRAAGAGNSVAAYWLFRKGEPWLRQLLQQDVALTRDARQQVEWTILNRYPIAVGAEFSVVTELHRQGAGPTLAWLAEDSELGSQLTPAFGNAALMKRAPHPEAAKLFLNWMLSREGQSAWAAKVEQASRRLDVANPPETAPKPGVQYINNQKEENVHYFDQAIELAKDTLK